MDRVRLRSYQQEMLAASLERNVIVAMDTGSGKTHVAIARIAAELERTDPEKLVIFLSPSVVLAMQQASVLSEHLPSTQVRALSGQDGVDKWTDQKLWDAVLANVQVVVATPAVLLDALSHGFIKLARLALLVFDEAHRATKNHPMNAILQRFYHPAKELERQIPHVLGLSASPVINSKQGSLEKIEDNLDARAVTPKQHRDELESYVHPPEFRSVLYQKSLAATIGSTDPLCIALAEASKYYDLKSDPYVVELGERDDEKAAKEMAKVLLRRETYCSKQLRLLDSRALAVEQELGSSMANWYVSACIEKYLEAMKLDNAIILPDLSEKERTHLAAIFESLRQADTEARAGLASSTALPTSHKAEQLITILRDADAASLRGIVFVEQRAQVTALAQLLRQTPKIGSRYKIGSFVGMSASRQMAVADLSDLKEQEKDLDAFRKGQSNLMIATTVLEEGIDVSACNLVICFEAPKNLVSFVQRRGRARQRESKYFLFIADEEKKRNSQKWRELEAQMKAAYMSDFRTPNEDSDGDDESVDRIYEVGSTKASLTLENAKSHLYHFCSVGTLQNSQCVDLRPEFDTTQNPSTNEWTASVSLPTFVHPDFRHAVSAKSWKSEQSAIKDAAFEAYVALHKAGLVNDNLLPLIRDYGPEAGQEHVDQPSLVEVSQRASSWRALWQNSDRLEAQWHCSRISVQQNSEEVVPILMWTPQSMTIDESFSLFWNEEATFVVTMSPSNKKLVDTDLPAARACTGMILRSVHANRMPEAAQDFPALFTPEKELHTLSRWLEGARGEHQLTREGDRSGNELDAGLIRIQGQIGRRLFFHGFQDREDDKILVRSFPKRKDFLHPISSASAESKAYTAIQTLGAGDCTISHLPSRYALFAAFLPSITHRMDIALLAQHLSRTMLQAVKLRDASLIVEAICSPAAQEGKDYNRLEYLGDSILKHCTELQVMAQHTNWPEAYLTAERDRIVRNNNLAKAAISIGLDKFISTTAFTGSKWRPSYVGQLLARAPENRMMSSKTLADVVEALIGAAYVDGGLEKALKCMEVLLPSERWLAPEACLDILVEDLSPTEYKNREMLESLIGYHFNHPALLVEAITHVSYRYNKTGLSYERMEFFGDSVLDMLVTPQLFAHPRELKHWELHRIHEALVNSHFLGYCCMSYAIEQERYDVVEEGTGHGIQTKTRLVHLHDFLRVGPELQPLRQKAMASFEQLRNAIDGSLEHDTEYPWPDLMALSLPKFFCDIVESVLGAIFIDSRGNMAACEAFAERLGILKHMRRILNDEVETINPKEKLGILADGDDVRYLNSLENEGQRVWSCTAQVGDEEIATVTDCGIKEEAEVKAADQACKVLLGRGRSAEAGRRKRKLADATMNDNDDDPKEDAMEIDSPLDANEASAE